jgi:hypothetical protein
MGKGQTVAFGHAPASVVTCSVHHTGYDLTHMRGTSSREDAASWVMRLD